MFLVRDKNIITSSLDVDSKTAERVRYDTQIIIRGVFDRYL